MSLATSSPGAQTPKTPQASWGPFRRGGGRGSDVRLRGGPRVNRRTRATGRRARSPTAECGVAHVSDRRVADLTPHSVAAGSFFFFFFFFSSRRQRRRGLHRVGDDNARRPATRTVTVVVPDDQDGEVDARLEHPLRRRGGEQDDAEDHTDDDARPARRLRRSQCSAARGGPSSGRRRTRPRPRGRRRRNFQPRGGRRRQPSRGGGVVVRGLALAGRRGAGAHGQTLPAAAERAPKILSGAYASTPRGVRTRTRGVEA